ncbi:MAG: ketopantoate reductase family protein [Thermoplasmatota archaeon]
MRFLVIGAGAIGAYVAAHLAKEHEVLVGVRSRASAELFEEVEAVGETRAQVRRVVASDPVQSVDGIIVATKTGAMEKVARTWAPWLKGNVIGIQNGLQDHFPSCIVAFPATRLDAGRSKRTGPGGFYLPLDAPACFDALRLAGPVKRVANMDGIRWTKLLINACATSLGALTGHNLSYLMADRRARDAFLAITREGYAVGLAEGVTFESMHGFHPKRFVSGPSFLHHALLRVVGHKQRNHRSSSLQSLERGEATEIDALNGEIVRRGAKHGIPTPFNQRILELDGQTPTMKHLDELLAA